MEPVETAHAAGRELSVDGEIIGRGPLIASLLGQVARAREGSGGVVVIRGEAGIGKTYVVDELARAARDEGVAVLRGRAEEFENAIPYAAFRGLLTARSAVEVFPAGRAARLVDVMAGDLGARAGASDLNRVSRVHAEMVGLLHDTAQSVPLVVVVEDLHVADPDSATLTRVLARSAASTGYLLVVSLRPQSAGDQTLDAVFAAMAEAGEAESVDVSRMDAQSVGDLAAQLLRARLTPDALDYVVRQTHGNPFFVKELLLGLQQSGALVEAEGGYQLATTRPTRIGRRTAILHRVFTSARSGRDVAKALAVLGKVHPGRMPLVAELSGADVATVEQSFDGLINDAILRSSSDGGYEFTHPLVRSALYEDIGPAERRRLHAAAARWLAGTGDSRDRLQATVHVAESATPGDKDAVALLLSSADATAPVAPMNAAAWYARALEILDPTDESRFDVQARQARALWLAGRPVEAGALGRLALAGLPDGDRERAAILTVNALYSAGAAVEALAVCDELIARGGGDAGGAHPTLRAQRLHIASQVGAGLSEPEPLPSRPTLVRKPGVVRITHLLLQADLVGDVDRRRAVLEIAREALALLATGPRLALLEAMAMVHADAGELADASAVMHEARRLAEDTEATNLGGQFAAARVRFHRLSGDWDAAFETARTATHELGEAQQLGNLCIVQALTGLMLVDQGRFDEAAARLDSCIPPVPSFEHLVGVVDSRRLRLSGDPEGAIAAATGIEERARERGWEQWRYLLVQEIVESEIARGRGSDAAWLAATLDPNDERPLHSVVRRRLIAATTGDAAAALEVQTFAVRSGLPVEAAMSAVVAARLGAPDVDLAQALATFETVGAVPWVFQVRQLMRERGMVPPRASGSTVGGLTATELKMAALVQQGLTNREIAGALHYSPKTVEVYLSRVYAKLGVTSRLALARAMDSGAIT